jgi:hypothetical protein
MVTIISIKVTPASRIGFIAVFNRSTALHFVIESAVLFAVHDCTLGRHLPGCPATPDERRVSQPGRRAGRWRAMTTRPPDLSTAGMAAT